MEEGRARVSALADPVAASAGRPGPSPAPPGRGRCSQEAQHSAGGGGRTTPTDTGGHGTGRGPGRRAAKEVATHGPEAGRASGLTGCDHDIVGGLGRPPRIRPGGRGVRPSPPRHTPRAAGLAPAQAPGDGGRCVRFRATVAPL